LLQLIVGNSRLTRYPALNYSNEFLIFFGRIIRACTRFTSQKNTVKGFFRACLTGAENIRRLGRDSKFGKEEVKWQKKESPRPMFQPALATRARPSAAAIAETR
jgi:hypothetical protein